MKRSLKKLICGPAAWTVLVLAIGFPVLSAQGANSGGGRLAGTWDARVTLYNCMTGQIIRSFDSLVIFTKDGAMIDSTSGIPQARKTPAKGVWSHVKGNVYRFKLKVFLFDEAGAYTGYQVITHEAYLDQSGDAFESDGVAEFFAPDGTPVFSGCSSTVSTRFDFD